MWDGPGGYQGYLNQVTLATCGNDYGPQNGPAVPRDYYYEPRELECGHSEEDCDGIECGVLAGEPDPNLINENDIDPEQRE